MAIDSETIFGSVKFVQFTFAGNITTTEGATSFKGFDGKVLHVVTSPSVTLVPSANWDLTILDTNGIDIMAGAGLNRSSGSTQHKLSSTMGAVAKSDLRFVVSNAGATGGGTVRVYIR